MVNRREKERAAAQKASASASCFSAAPSKTSSIKSAPSSIYPKLSKSPTGLILLAKQAIILSNVPSTNYFRLYQLQFMLKFLEVRVSNLPSKVRTPLPAARTQPLMPYYSDVNTSSTPSCFCFSILPLETFTVAIFHFIFNPIFGLFLYFCRLN
jgi:hypothetical protein